MTAMGLMDRFLNLIGFEEEEEEEVEEVPEPSHEEKRLRRAPLVSLPGGGRQMRVIVCEPVSFDEAQGVADQLKARRPVILNLEGMDKEQAQRILNFLSGCTYALDGNMQRVGTGIFLLAPSNVEVAMDEIAEATRGQQERGAGLFGR
jgi:cell division inhibitor SepF